MPINAFGLLKSDFNHSSQVLINLRLYRNNSTHYGLCQEIRKAFLKNALLQLGDNDSLDIVTFGMVFLLRHDFIILHFQSTVCLNLYDCRGGNSINQHVHIYNNCYYTLNLKRTISPSCITYSLPSRRTSPFSFADAIVPHDIRSLYETISARIKPFSKSV